MELFLVAIAVAGYFALDRFVLRPRVQRAATDPSHPRHRQAAIAERHLKKSEAGLNKLLTGKDNPTMTQKVIGYALWVGVLAIVAFAWVLWSQGA